MLTSADPFAPTFEPWEPLPNELKLFVLSYAFANDEPINEDEHRKLLKDVLAPLMLNEEMRQLLPECYYKSNTFILTPIHQWGVYQRLTSPPLKYANYITHLILQLDTPMENTPLNALLHSELLYVFVHAKRHADFIDPTDMWFPKDPPTYLTHFPKLEILDVNVNFLSDTYPNPWLVWNVEEWLRKYDWDHKCFGNKVNEMVNVLRQCEIVVQAKDIRVKVYCEGCRKNGMPGPKKGAPAPEGVTDGRTLAALENPGCTCEGRLKGVFKKWLRGKAVAEDE